MNELNKNFKLNWWNEREREGYGLYALCQRAKPKPKRGMWMWSTIQNENFTLICLICFLFHFHFSIFFFSVTIDTRIFIGIENCVLENEYYVSNGNRALFERICLCFSCFCSPFCLGFNFANYWIFWRCYAALLAICGTSFRIFSRVFCGVYRRKERVLQHFRFFDLGDIKVTPRKRWSGDIRPKTSCWESIEIWIGNWIFISWKCLEIWNIFGNCWKDPAKTIRNIF